MSAQVLLLNPTRPKHRRRKARRHNRRGRMPTGLAKYWANRGRGHRRRKGRARRRVVARASNPHTGKHYRRRRRAVRRAYSRRRHHNRRHHARRRRSNPISLRGLIPNPKGILDNYVVPGVIGGIGALGLDIAWGYLSPHLPQQVQTGWSALAAKLGVIVVATIAANKLLPPKFRNTTLRAAKGAAVMLGYSAVKGMAASVLPAGTPGLHGYIDYQSYSLPTARGMHGYMPRTLGGLGDDFYSPAAVIQPPGVAVPRQFGGYVAVQPNMLNGYQPHMSSGMGSYDWQNDGM